MSDAVETRGAGKTPPKETFAHKVYLTAISAIVSVAICVGSALGTSTLLTARMDERVTYIREQSRKHEQEKQHEFERHADTLRDHDQRLARLEALTGSLQGNALGDPLRRENPVTRWSAMNLHEQMAADLDDVFLNLDEFACIHDFNGKKIKCIVDDQQGLAATGAADGFANVSGLGLLQCERVLYCNAADLVPQPLPGEKIIMDGVNWLVADAGVAETEGMLALPLKRAF